MTWVVRIIALGLELFGLYYVLKLAHQDNYRGALTRLAFEVVLVLVFVTCHVFVEMVLRDDRRGGPPWWLR
jgi:hypothetical protein